MHPGVKEPCVDDNVEDALPHDKHLQNLPIVKNISKQCSLWNVWSNSEACNSNVIRWRVLFQVEKFFFIVKIFYCQELLIGKMVLGDLGDTVTARLQIGSAWLSFFSSKTELNETYRN